MFKVNKVVLNGAEVRNLLKSPGIAGLCESLAHEKAAELGPGYEVKTYVAATRFVARVGAESDKACSDNLKRNTLLKAFGGSVE